VTRQTSQPWSWARPMSTPTFRAGGAPQAMTCRTRFTPRRRPARRAAAAGPGRRPSTAARGRAGHRGLEQQRPVHRQVRRGLKGRLQPVGQGHVQCVCRVRPPHGQERVRGCLLIIFAINPLHFGDNDQPAVATTALTGTRCCTRGCRARKLGFVPATGARKVARLQEVPGSRSSLTSRRSGPVASSRNCRGWLRGHRGEHRRPISAERSGP
jgi:hypothetical protein